MAETAAIPLLAPASRTTEDTTALAIMVIGNWLMAHLATSWVLPPEVMSACQTLITIGLAAWLNRQQRQAPAKITVPTPPSPEPLHEP